MSRLPLDGRRVLVTRAAHQAGKLSQGLRELGAEVVEVPLLAIEPPASFEALDRALHSLADYHWILFTSANTVRAVQERAAALGLEAVPAAGARVGAVGAATAAAAAQAGFRVDVVPESYVAEGLIAALDGPLAGQLDGKCVLLARAAVARDVIPDALRAAGAHVDVVDAYRNALPADAPARLKAALAQPVDAIPFTSSSSVTHLAEAAAAAGMEFPFAAVKAVSIGPVTTAELRAHTWQPAAEADPHDVAGLIAAVVRALYSPF